jgi:DNA-binding transcriptional ArsR family regulator
LAKAAQLRKPALPAGLGLWFVRGVSQKSGPVRASAAIRKKVGLSAGQMLRGLRALEGAGLVRFVKEGRGRCPVVEIVAQLRPEAHQT